MLRTLKSTFCLWTPSWAAKEKLPRPYFLDILQELQTQHVHSWHPPLPLLLSPSLNLFFSWCLSLPAQPEASELLTSFIPTSILLWNIIEAHHLVPQPPSSLRVRPSIFYPYYSNNFLTSSPQPPSKYCPDSLLKDQTDTIALLCAGGVSRSFSMSLTLPFPSHLLPGTLNSSLVVPQIHNVLSYFHALHSHYSLWNCSSPFKDQLCEIFPNSIPSSSLLRHDPPFDEFPFIWLSLRTVLPFIVKGICPPFWTMSITAVLSHSSMYSPGTYHGSWYIISVLP